MHLAGQQSYHAVSKNLSAVVAQLSGAKERWLTSSVSLAVICLQVDHEQTLPDWRRLDLRAALSALERGDVASAALSEKMAIRKGDCNPDGPGNMS